MCKGVSKQSLHMYARMNETTYTYWVRQALLARVDSTRTTNLVAQIPRTDDDDVVARLLGLSFVEERE